MHVQRGLFVTLEGGEGSGKDTQVELLAAKLKLLGVNFIEVREPGGTRISEMIRSLLLDPKNTDMLCETELLLFEAARTQIVGEKIEPALVAGINVLANRFFDSSTAYQGFGRGINRGSVASLNHFAARGVKPDLTIYLDIDPVVALARATKDGADRIERAGIEFHQRVREGFLWCADKEPNRFKVIDASGTIEEVEPRVDEHALPMFLERR